MDYIPQKFKIEYAPDGTPCICGNTIINKDGITEINVSDGVSGEKTSTHSIGKEITLYAVKIGDIIEVHKLSRRVNEYYRFRVLEIGKQYVTAVPDGGIAEI